MQRFLCSHSYITKQQSMPHDTQSAVLETVLTETHVEINSCCMFHNNQTTTKKDAKSCEREIKQNPIHRTKQWCNTQLQAAYKFGIISQAGGEIILLVSLPFWHTESYRINQRSVNDRSLSMLSHTH